MEVRLEEAMVFKPTDPFEGGELDVFEVAPRTARTNELGLAEPRRDAMELSDDQCYANKTAAAVEEHDFPFASLLTHALTKMQ